MAIVNYKPAWAGYYKAGNANMKNNGRTKWNGEDIAAAIKAYRKICTALGLKFKKEKYRPKMAA